MKREQCDEDKDKDDLKKATGKGVEEKIRQKIILENIFLVTEINVKLSLCSLSFYYYLSFL
jgi:hypothetical protein